MNNYNKGVKHHKALQNISLLYMNVPANTQ